MMKNKKNLYFLVPAVVLIWGMIIYRVLDFQTEDPVGSVARPFVVGDTEHADEDYRPAFNYPDPFLKKLNTVQVASTSPVEEEPETVMELPKADTPPVTYDIAYKGYVTPSGATGRVALLLINGKEVFLKRGESYEDFRVSRIYSDSVMIAVADERISIVKQ